MNWSYLGVAALLSLVVALGATLAVGAFQAVRLTRLGAASRPAYSRMFKSMAFAFPLVFVAAAVWDGGGTWRGLFGVALGRPVDQRALGLLRTHGKGFLKKNPAKAAHWFRKAAEGGDAEAQFLLACALLRDTGLPRDPKAALRWAKAAADQGLPEAMVLAGDLLPPAEANTWYQRTLVVSQNRIQRRDPEACLAYGLMHVNGKGVPKDAVEGFAWMLIARRLGLDSYRSLIVQLTEATLSKAQRDEAAERAQTHLAVLAQPEKG